MPQLIRTKAQLQSILENKLRQVINIVGEKIETQLKKNIMEHTYNTEPNKWYQPTYEFLNSFYWQQAKKELGNFIQGYIIYNYTNMSLPRPSDEKGSQLPWQHGNIYAKRLDVRKEMAAILNIDGPNRGLPIFFGKKREPFFDITLDWITNNFDDMIINAFAQVGLKVTKKVGAL